MTGDLTVIQTNIAYYRDRLKQNLSDEQRLAVERLLCEATGELVAAVEAIMARLVC